MSSASLTLDEWMAILRFDAGGLLPAVVQDSVTREVLMVAWMNAESLRRTFELGETVFWSRSRGELWHKGATSGNTQAVVELRVDCDGDTLLILVRPAGPACHTGATSCFYRALASGPGFSHSQQEAGESPPASVSPNHKEQLQDDFA